MKVAVYTIALNESAHVERWANSAGDADYRVVADTGSTDDTVERLTAAGVMVNRIAIRPWRFAGPAKGTWVGSQVTKSTTSMASPTA